MATFRFQFRGSVSQQPESLLITYLKICAASTAGIDWFLCTTLGKYHDPRLGPVIYVLNSDMLDIVASTYTQVVQVMHMPKCPQRLGIGNRTGAQLQLGAEPKNSIVYRSLWLTLYMLILRYLWFLHHFFCYTISS